jgi:hypothetical protein
MLDFRKSYRILQPMPEDMKRIYGLEGNRFIDFGVWPGNNEEQALWNMHARSYATQAYGRKGGRVKDFIFVDESEYGDDDWKEVMRSRM